MRSKVFFAIAGLALTVLPTLAFADLYKCVNASGVSSFSDTPCVAKEGAKEVNIKNNPAFASIIARDQDRLIGRYCSDLTDRRSQCNTYVDAQIQLHFNDNCYAPMKRYEADREQQAQNNQTEGIDWDHDYRYHRKSSVELSCAGLPSDMWEFVKHNFSKSMSDQEIQEIEYRIQAPSSDPQNATAPRYPRRTKRALTQVPSE